MENSRQDKYAIHEAARLGQTNVVESLLNANPKLSTLRDPDDRLALHWAVSGNHLDIVDILARVGMGGRWDVDVKDGSGWTPLMIAVSIKDGEAMVGFLIGQGADVNAKNSAGQTSLHLTASKSNLSTARLLLSHSATARVKDRRGQTPLHRAAAVGSVPMIQLLLDAKCPVDATDGEGWSGLFHAIAEGHGDAALALLKAGADAGKKDGEGKVALDFAPDAKVRQFIVQSAEREGIQLA